MVLTRTTLRRDRDNDQKVCFVNYIRIRIVGKCASNFLYKRYNVRISYHINGALYISLPIYNGA